MAVPRFASSELIDVACVAALLVSVVIDVACVAALAKSVVIFVVAVPRLASSVTIRAFAAVIFALIELKLVALKVALAYI